MLGGSAAPGGRWLLKAAEAVKGRRAAAAREGWRGSPCSLRSAVGAAALRGAWAERGDGLPSRRSAADRRLRPGR